MTGKLPACPFCGFVDCTVSRGLISKWSFVYCPGCLAEGPACNTEDEAIAAWTRRAPAQQPSGEVTDIQWWLAELDQYGNPKLSDGAHRERAGADKAMYLIKNLGLDTKGKRWAVARVELSEPHPSADGVNMEAVETCRAMVDAARAQGGGRGCDRSTYR
ncbi:Lar family restriction alleviation protein [Burkholderia ubonensis]|uniref:Lar family restriction alleviation protein n=1 Tax=Burkholderia ubonensis TaxID=101571 RepID=UPI000A8AECD9|nr:Lar family restriction alleviation protein [Burkholderia ubonensis]